jgi:hypothetical protein
MAGRSLRNDYAASIGTQMDAINQVCKAGLDLNGPDTDYRREQARTAGGLVYI